MIPPSVAEKAEKYCLQFMRGRAIFSSDQVKCIREAFLAGYTEAQSAAKVDEGINPLEIDAQHPDGFCPRCGSSRMCPCE